MTLDPLEPRPRSVMEPVWSRRDGRERDRHRDREREKGIEVLMSFNHYN